MVILGIESSCDETGVALYDSDKGLLGHRLHSQVLQHAQYGGVVPELASRDHIRFLSRLVKALLAECGITPSAIDAVAYTAGPGLVGALLVGAGFARSLAWAWEVPCIPVHHMEGHLLAPMLEPDRPEFPFLALLISGGHTLLVEVNSIGDYQLLGESLDDAVGEAFDKTAKLLGLPYPGGALLAELAEQGDTQRFRFPRPMVDRPGLDFSFSGLKTFAVNTYRNHTVDEQLKADIACAFQEAVVDTLCIKCQRGLKQTHLQRLVIAGGVSANKKLRQRLAEVAAACSAQLYYPRYEFCTDNGAMIAYAGYRRFNDHMGDDLSIFVKPRWPITDLTPVKK